MTKEKIIQAIADDKTMPFIQPEQLSGIVDFVIKNYKPFLPSNLDEAAKKIAFGVCKYLPSGIERDSIIYYAILAAIAGAEWMAGQGYTKEGIARPDDCEIWVNIENTDIKDGDEVVVQIRKK